MISRAFLITAFVFTLSSSLAADTKGPREPTAAEAEKQVLDLEQKWAAAEVKADAATLHGILHDRFVATLGAGKPRGKESFIKAIVGDGVVDATASQTLTDETVVVDRDTAVVIGTDTARGIDEGKAYTQVYRYTVTYIWRDGRWLALAEHLVRVPPPN